MGDMEIGEKATETGLDGQAGGEPPAEPRKTRGRPRKDATAAPLSHEPPPAAKKEAQDIRNTHAAIHSTVERLRKLVEIHRERFPETECGDVVNPLEVKKDTIGAPVEKTAFHPPLIGLCRLTGWICGLGPEELPKQEDYDRCAESWARTSTHLGLKEKTAALFSSISETVGVVGFTIGRGIKKAWLSPKDDLPKTSPDAPLTEERPEPEKVEEKKGGADVADSGRGWSDL